jgi:hypothetical protein
MTHTLHRAGEVKELLDDYVMIVLAAKAAKLAGSEGKLQEIWEIVSHYEKDLANFGNLEIGNSHKTTMDALKKGKNRVVQAVFKNRETLKSCLKELKDRDFGLSVTISGLYDAVEKICAELGLSPPHTVEHSLGVHGRTDKLPDGNTLEITTMCGHSMVSPNLVSHLLGEIDAGNKTREEAANILSKQCVCGVFNPCRAERILRRIASSDGEQT